MASRVWGPGDAVDRGLMITEDRGRGARHTDIHKNHVTGRVKFHCLVTCFVWSITKTTETKQRTNRNVVWIEAVPSKAEQWNRAVLKHN
jgi:hypothetical protein